MEFKDFKIGQFFWYNDAVYKVTSLVTAIGAVEALGNDGILYYFDYCNFKYCKAVTIDPTHQIS